MARDADEDALRVAVKAEIRTRRRALRNALPKEARERRSAAIGERVAGLDEWDKADTILAFVSMRTEVQTRALVERAWSEGKRVAAPRLSAERDDLTLHRWEEGDPLEESGMMFLQPRQSAERIAEDAVDLVLVPALALDERGHRVGFGRGFYDRLLPRLVRATRVGIIFHFELVAEVPERDADEPVDVIVTDERVVRTGAR